MDAIPRSTIPALAFLGVLLAWNPARGDDAGATSSGGPRLITADRPVTITFPTVRARFVRLRIHSSAGGQPCLDELEIYDATSSDNLAQTTSGARAIASSCLPGYAIHQVAHLNDGQYGNDHSWIAATDHDEWAGIELPSEADVARVVFSRDRKGIYRDRLPVHFDVQISRDGREWKTVHAERAIPATNPELANATAWRVPFPEPLTWERLMRYAFLCERDTWERVSQADPLAPAQTDHPACPDGPSYWKGLAEMSATARTLQQFSDLIERLAASGRDVTSERAQRDAFAARLGKTTSPDDETSL